MEPTSSKTNKDQSSPAFACSHSPLDNAGDGSTGMTLRDYFAAAALIGLASNQNGGMDNPKDVASDCYGLADAMLKERER